MSSELDKNDSLDIQELAAKAETDLLSRNTYQTFYPGFGLKKLHDDEMPPL